MRCFIRLQQNYIVENLYQESGLNYVQATGVPGAPAGTIAISGIKTYVPPPYHLLSQQLSFPLPSSDSVPMIELTYHCPGSAEQLHDNSAADDPRQLERTVAMNSPLNTPLFSCHSSGSHLQINVLRLV